MSLNKELMIVLTTEANSENAEVLAEKILRKKLAACISFHQIESMYWWNSQLKRDGEVQIMIKTTKFQLGKLLDTVKDLHSYENPELLYWEASSSNSYLNWANKVTGSIDSL